MRPRASSLNPHAAAFVPASKRVADGETCVPYNDGKSNEGPVRLHTPQQATQNLSTSQAWNVKSHPESSSSGSAVQAAFQMVDKQMLDEDTEMDLEFLRMTFPGISDQSLTDVYMVNGRDVEAAIDMLNYLEFDGVQSAENLPETLDIGDTSESGGVVDSASLKLKNAAAKAGTSGPSAPPNIP